MSNRVNAAVLEGDRSGNDGEDSGVTSASDGRWRVSLALILACVALIASGAALAFAVVNKPNEACSTTHTDRCPVQVPSFVGGPVGNVGNALRGADLIPIITFQASTAVPKGVVLAQDPLGGSLVKRVTRVTLVVSSGP